MSKRKRSTVAADAGPGLTNGDLPPPTAPLSRKPSARAKKPKEAALDANPDTNSQIIDGSQALRASPDADEADESFKIEAVIPNTKAPKEAPATPKTKVKPPPSDSSLSDLSDIETGATSPAETEAPTPKPKPLKAKPAKKETAGDPEEGDEEDEPADEEEIQQALSRPPPVDSDYLPLPWKGRLGYACLNTYLRAAHIPIFCSRTCRIASILENRHPLADPSQPPHATKNRPDKTQPASIERGQKYVEAICLTNVRDLPKMLRWNDKYGIKFMRLSSEMFPFASHEEYGYKLEPFAAEALAEAGKVVAELGHRVTTHPGQFTQLGSPRKPVIENSFRDLEYHAEMLRLLKLPEQQNRDAVMILHMGGVFGDKAATLDRFRENYAKLSQDVKNRLVLENDDMSWSVHDLLPICEEMNIPMVLDYHHHNIIFDSEQIREGTLDIMNLYDRIAATWKRKGITQKMHYSEPTPKAITGQQRRKHSPRVKTLPPCAQDMDLMIEAKDKEQAVFELMRIFKLPGWDTFNDVQPYTRHDENRPWKPPPKKKTPRKKKGDPDAEIIEEPEPQPPPIVPDEEIAMGGPDNRVYWPPTMEEWLRPKKREIKKKEPGAAPASAKKPKKEAPAGVKKEVVKEEEAEENVVDQSLPSAAAAATPSQSSKTKKPAAKAKSAASKKPKVVKKEPTPSASDEEMDDVSSAPDLDPGSDEPSTAPKTTAAKPSLGSRRQSGRGAKKAVTSYADEDDSMAE